MRTEHRYPKRLKEKRRYEEPEISDEDEYLCKFYVILTYEHGNTARALVVMNAVDT